MFADGFTSDLDFIVVPSAHAVDGPRPMNDEIAGHRRYHEYDDPLSFSEVNAVEAQGEVFMMGGTLPNASTIQCEVALPVKTPRILDRPALSVKEKLR